MPTGNYTKTNNSVATFGEESDSVGALQRQLNQKFSGQAGYTPLLVDNKYGPLTKKAAAFNPGIVSSTPARNDLSQGSDALDRMTTQPDPYMEYLQKKANGLLTTSSEPGTDEKNIAQQSGRLEQKSEQDFAAYKAGLETLGIQSGLARYAPELQADRMINASNNETAKLSEIQDKEDLAIARAKQARLDKDASTLKSTLEEIRQIKKDKADELTRQLGKRTQDITVAKSISNYAYKHLKTMDDSEKENFILQLSKDNNINPATLIGALAEEEDTQKKLAKSLAPKSTGPKAASTKPLSTAALNYLKKNNPMLDIGFGDTQADADQAIATGKAWLSAVTSDFDSDPTAVGPQGYLTYDYVQKILNNLPQGLSRTGFIAEIKDKLTPKLGKHYKDYGLTKAEADLIMGE